MTIPREKSDHKPYTKLAFLKRGFWGSVVDQEEILWPGRGRGLAALVLTVHEPDTSPKRMSMSACDRKRTLKRRLCGRLVREGGT